MAFYGVGEACLRCGCDVSHHFTMWFVACLHMGGFVGLGLCEGSVCV